MDMSDTKGRAQSIATIPKVKISLVPVVIQHVVIQPIMSIKEQKMLDRFFRLTPPRFLGVPCKDLFF